MDNESKILNRRLSFPETLPPVGDPMRPDWYCLYTKAQIVGMLGGWRLPTEVPGKGQPPIVVEFTTAPEGTYRYAEIAWEPYTSDVSDRLYSYKLWQQKPVALPIRAVRDGDRCDVYAPDPPLVPNGKRRGTYRNGQWAVLGALVKSCFDGIAPQGFEWGTLGHEVKHVFHGAFHD